MNHLQRNQISNYLKRFAASEVMINQAIHPDCRMIIVIPCHNEPDLIGTIESLLQCKTPSFHTEVIVVVNQKIGEENSALSKQNHDTISDFNDWNRKVDNISFYLIEMLNMPKKHAGVGLARKTGMDEALRRFASLDFNGSIVCLDSDCRVSKNYLTALDGKFVQSDAGLGEVHFEHQFELEEDAGLKKGIINYELFLYYYVEGLKSAGFPYAIQTIGSCMLVKSATYAKHGGMNKRKAGEDFYFLHKIIPHEQFVEVNTATVYPSCRTSDRVPFGTGKAQQDWLDQASEEYLTYDPRVFDELRSLISSVPEFFKNNLEQSISSLSTIPKAFITFHAFETKIAAIKSNCKSIQQFEKQFFIWFDGFLCMKFIHFTRDNYYGDISIVSAANRLIKSELNHEVQLLKALQKRALH